METALHLEKNPIHSLILVKKELRYNSMTQMVEYFKEKITAYPMAHFIAAFDHYTKKKSLDGMLMKGLENAKNIVFCFKNAIPSTTMASVRQLSIGICEFEDRFVIEFADATSEAFYAVIEGWTKELVD